VPSLALIARRYRGSHKSALRLVDDLSEEQFRWRRSPGPQSIGWNLWHTARWDDYLAEVLVAHTPALSHLGPARQVWKAQDLAKRWGLDSSELGLEEGGTELTDAAAAAMNLPPKADVVAYVVEAFDHLDAVLSALDDSLFDEILPTVETQVFPRQGLYWTNVMDFMNHVYEHIGTMEALKGLLGLQGGVTG
jgi:hypothetical protein